MPAETCQVQFVKKGPTLTTTITSPHGTVVTIAAHDETDGQLEDGLHLTLEVLKVCAGPEQAMQAMKTLADRFVAMRLEKI